MLPTRENPTEPSLFGDMPFEGLKLLEEMSRFRSTDEKKAILADLEGICALLKALGVTAPLTSDVVRVIVDYTVCESRLYDDVQRYLARPDDDNLAELAKRAKGLANMRGHRGETKGRLQPGHGKR